MRMMDPPRDAPGLRPQDADAPPRRGALDRALARLETLFEVGASALVPLATIAFPTLLAWASFWVLPPSYVSRPPSPPDAGEGFASLAPYAPEAGTAAVEPVEATDDAGDAAPSAPRPAPADPAPAADVAPPTDAPPVDAPGDAAAAAPEGAGASGDIPSPAPTRPTKVGGRSSKCAEKSNPAIAALGEKKWQIDRALIDHYATHLKALDTLGYIERWKSEDGETKGFRLGGIGCGNDLHLSGIRSGDVVLQINDRKVGSIPEALAAYAKYRKADFIRVTLLRKGEVREHVYRLH
jgi:hypothetical protein